MTHNGVRIFGTPHRHTVAHWTSPFYRVVPSITIRTRYLMPSSFSCGSSRNLLHLNPPQSTHSPFLLTPPNAASLCSRMLHTSLTGPWQDLVRWAWLMILCYSSFTLYHLQIKQRSQKDRGPVAHWFTSEWFYDLKHWTVLENVLTAETSTEYSVSSRVVVG